MAKHPRRKYRNGDEPRVALRAQDRIGRQRHFRAVELFVIEHAPERLARPQRNECQIDAFGLDPAIDQRLGAVVTAAGHGEFQFFHEMPSRLLRGAAVIFPSPLWGGVGVGVERSCRNVDECESPPDPLPNLSPQGGGLQRMMLGLRMLWSQSIRLTCLAWIFQTAPSRTTRCPTQPVSTRVSSPQNSLIRKFDRTMRVSSRAVAKTSTLVTRRTVRDAGACDQANPVRIR